MVRRNPPLTDDEIAAYERDDSPSYISKTRFRIDFTRSPTAFAFNVEARDYYIRHLLRAMRGGMYKNSGIPERYVNEDHIGSAYDTYMETCRERYRHVVNPPTSEKIEKGKAHSRRNSRKTTLFSTRQAALMEHGCDHHLDLFSLLDAEHMSGDETERDEKGNKVRPPAFLIMNPEWMSDEYRSFMHTLDEWHYSKRFTKGKDTGGNFPRTRKSQSKVVTAPAPIGLYRNCYSMAYLAKLKPYQRRALCIVDKDYNFTLPALDTEDQVGEQGRENLDGDGDEDNDKDEIGAMDSQAIGKGKERVPVGI
ncbi:hypothetical protein C8Q78DRAFT_454103 [Trametes maxima]|nr:hypothetical protein C8Q78DRAFT_454103 [Trametes maxima]